MNGKSQNDCTDHLKLGGFERIFFDGWDYSVKVAGVGYRGEEEGNSRERGIGREEFGGEEDGGGWTRWGWEEGGASS